MKELQRHATVEKKMACEFSEGGECSEFLWDLEVPKEAVNQTWNRKAWVGCWRAYSEIVTEFPTSGVETCGVAAIVWLVSSPRHPHIPHTAVQ